MNNKEIIKYVSTTLNRSEYITINSNQIIYEKVDTRANKSYKIDIQDKFFIDAMILGNIYMPRKESVIDSYNRVKNLDVKDLHRPKNTAQKQLLINDNDFSASIDMYIQEYSEIFEELISLLKKTIFMQLNREI